MKVKLKIDLTLNTVADFTKSEESELVKNLTSKINDNIELLLSDIPIPNHLKLLEGFNYKIKIVS